jgi:hypothetical protein
MSLIANLFLTLATLLYFSSLSPLYFKSAPKGGDAAVSYVWGIIFIYLGFLVCMAIPTGIIAWKGGFQWTGSTGTRRFAWVAGTLVMAVLTIAISALSRDGGGPVPLLLRLYSVFIPALLPALMIVGAAVLANESLASLLPNGLVKWMMKIIFFLSLSGSASFIWSLMAQSLANDRRKIERAMEDNEKNHQNHLKDIENCDVSKDMVFILVFTDANHDPDVREKALAKIRTNPQWEKEMIRYLETDWAPEAFTFFASNEVPDKMVFAEAIRTGILIQARLIRENIQRYSHSSHYYPDQFGWEVERVLRTVDRFSDTGVDYLPAVIELRKALTEKSEYKEGNYRIESVLDKWIKNKK